MQIQKDYGENLKYVKFSSDEFIDKYDFKPGCYYSFNKEPDFNSFKYRYDFYLTVRQSSEKFTLSASYNDQLYSQDYVHLFLKSIETIINQFLSCDISKLTLSDICLVKENASLQFKDIQTPLIHKRFEKQVEMVPDNIALVSNGERLTYRQLNEKANKIANALITNGVEPRDNVLVMLPRNSDLIASIMGILKAGCAYIPIDPAYPKERIRYIYENSNADHIIADSEIEGSIKIDELLKEDNIANPNINIDGDDLAYVIYTSGSTGEPKGVMGRHRNITSVFSKDENNEIYNAYVKMNKNLGISTVSFVAFLVDFISLTFGTTLILANDDEIENMESLARLMQNEKPDALTFITPSRLKQYLEYETFTKKLSSIDYIAIGGEMVTKDVLSKLPCDETKVYIAYGSSETSGFATIEKINDLNNDLTIENQYIM